MTNLSEKDRVLALIDTDMAVRRKWSAFDFIFAQVILWGSVLASFVTAVWTAYGAPEDASKLWLTAIAAIPALVVAIEHVFDFPKRHKMNAAAFNEYATFANTIRSGSDALRTEAEYIEYRKQFDQHLPLGVPLKKLGFKHV